MSKTNPKFFKCTVTKPPKDDCPPPPKPPCPPPPPANDCPPEPCKPMSNQTTNNYYYSDSHNTTVTTTNTYSTTDSHNTSNEVTTNNNYSYDSHNTSSSVTTNNYYSNDSHDTTTTNSTDSHNTTVNVSLVDGGALNGSLNNVLNNVLSGNDILTGDIRTGDILSGNDILSPTIKTGDINVDVSDIVHDVLNPTTKVGDVLSPDVGDVLSNFKIDDVAVNVLPIAGDVLSNIDVVDISGVSAIVNPVVGDVLSNIANESLLKVIAPAELNILSDNVTKVGDVLSDLVDAKVLNDVVDVKVLNDVVDAKVLGIVPVAAEILNGVGNGNLNHITTELAPTVEDVVGKIGVIANAGDVLNASVGDVIAKIGALDLHDVSAPVNISDFAQDTTANVIGTILSGIGDGISAELLDHAGSVDLSDVGALLNVGPLQDIDALNFDLDHLTSKVDLFDTGHPDVMPDGHHA